MNVIPVIYVPISSKDKPWITPLVKHLIHRRWEAFRRRDFVRYQYLKELIRLKIEKAKLDWAKKLSCPSDLWDKVNVIKSRKCKDTLDQLYNSHSDFKNLGNTINSIFGKNFNNSSCNPDAFDKLFRDNVNHWDFSITEESVFKLLDSCDSRKAYGSDCVPTFL